MKILCYIHDEVGAEVFAENEDGVRAILDEGLLVAEINGATTMATYRDIQEIADISKMKSVKGVSFVLNSPGGAVNGLMETCAEIKAIDKPTFAYTETLAASAAYALGCCADKFYASPSADVGSVGARIMHMDISKMVSDMGIKVTEVGYGKKKTQFSPFKPLTSDDKKELESIVKDAYNDFVDYVKMNRKDVKDEIFDSGVYSGKKSIDMGLTDGLISTGKSFIEFSKKVLQ